MTAPARSRSLAWARLRLAVVAVAALSAVGCRGRPPDTQTATTKTTTARRAFYYWRTTFALDARENETLRRHHVERLYLRLFDVAPDKATGQPVPVGRCALAQPAPAGVEIVPVIFLANRVFEDGPVDAAALALKVWTLARDMAAGAGFGFRELQVDCDWSERTRAAFFAFCRALGAAAHARGAQLGATIRLHQIKYPRRTGVPPVDRGMLMFYNVGQLSADPPRPSIFNTEDAGRYVDSIDRYPLPLDAALPIFSWAIHGRGDHVVGLIEKIGAPALDAEPALQRRAPGRYVATRSSFFRGGYLQEGDTLALETMTPALTRAAAALLAEHFHPRHAFTLTLFDLDERNLIDHAPDDLEAVYSAIQ